MRAFLKGFGYAAKGVYKAVLQERNMRFHLCAAVYVYVFSLFYNFDAVQYILLTLIVAGMFALELINSAIERVVDMHETRSPLAAAAKDMAAGAVLVFSIGAVVCGIWLFGDVHVLRGIVNYFATHIAALILLLLSVLGALWFVFVFGNKKEEIF